MAVFLKARPAVRWHAGRLSEPTPGTRTTLAIRPTRLPRAIATDRQKKWTRLEQWTKTDASGPAAKNVGFKM